MAPNRLRIAVPTNAALPHSHRVQSSPSIIKALSRLSRTALTTLVLEWLDDKNQPLCRPFLEGDDEEADEEDDSVYTAAASLEELKEIYMEMQEMRGPKREVVNRVVEGDWKHGLNLYQLATVDMRYLSTHSTSHKWGALKLTRVVSPEKYGEPPKATKPTQDLPRFHAATFLRNLQREISPLVKAHYFLIRLKSLSLLRILILDSPYTTQTSLLSASTTTQLADTSKTLFIAFPDGTPQIYVSLANSGAEGRGLRKIVLDALPKAISRAHSRFKLQTTSLTANTLSALLFLRGPGRGEAAAGGWSIFLDDSVDGSPLDPTPKDKRLALEAAERNEEEVKENEGNSFDPEEKENRPSHGYGRGRPPLGARPVKRKSPPPASEEERQRSKRLRTIAQARFGPSGREGDGRGIETLQIRMEDPFAGVPGSSTELPFEIYDDDNSAPAPRDQQAEGLQRRKKGGRPSWDALFETAGEGEEPRRREDGWTPEVRLGFQGTHVFAGVRKLVEIGVVDGEKMPGWLTGEDGVSFGVVRGGRMVRRGV